MCWFPARQRRNRFGVILLCQTESLCPSSLQKGRLTAKEPGTALEISSVVTLIVVGTHRLDHHEISLLPGSEWENNACQPCPASGRNKDAGFCCTKGTHEQNVCLFPSLYYFTSGIFLGTEAQNGPCRPEIANWSPFSGSQPGFAHRMGQPAEHFLCLSAARQHLRSPTSQLQTELAKVS